MQRAKAEIQKKEQSKRILPYRISCNLLATTCLKAKSKGRNQLSRRRRNAKSKGRNTEEREMQRSKAEIQKKEKSKEQRQKSRRKSGEGEYYLTGFRVSRLPLPARKASSRALKQKQLEKKQRLQQNCLVVY